VSVVVDFEPTPIAGGDHGVVVWVVAGDGHCGRRGKRRFDGGRDRMVPRRHYPKSDLG
jgi:hypothetical protein